MSEVELKILEINVDEVIAKLLDLGAEQTFSGLVKSTFFDTPDRALKKSGKLLRLREVGDERELTVKEPCEKEGQCKVRTEHQVSISSLKQAVNLLQALGYEQVKYHEKRRTSFACDNIHCEIDQYPNVPAYLEIEGQSEEEVLEFLDKLGFSSSDAKDWTATKVLKEYLGKEAALTTRF